MGMVMAFLLLSLLGSFVFLGHAQQAPPPDCQTQLTQALSRTGTAQTLAKEDREGLILYFQKIVQECQAEQRKVMQERDELRKQVDEQKKGKDGQ